MHNVKGLPQDCLLALIDCLESFSAVKETEEVVVTG